MATYSPTGQYALLDSHNLKGLFDTMYEKDIAGTWASQIGMPMVSDLASETYGWLGAAPSLEELKGDITEEQLAKFSYTLRNVEYAKALKFAAKDLRRDKLGQIQTRIGEMSSKAADHWNRLTSTLILNGATSGNNSYDGTTFFSAVHAESGTNQVNALTNSHVAALNIGTSTDPTADEAAAALVGVLGKFYELTDDKGDPINGTASNFLVMVGTSALWAPFNHAVAADRLSSGAANTVMSLKNNTQNGLNISVLLNPRLSSATAKFYVFRTDGVVKPFILQEEIPLDSAVTTDQSDEFVKYRRYILSLYTSRAAGYGRWQSAMQATLS